MLPQVGPTGEMAIEVKVVVDGGMDREKFLSVASLRFGNVAWIALVVGSSDGSSRPDC